MIRKKITIFISLGLFILLMAIVFASYQHGINVIHKESSLKASQASNIFTHKLSNEADIIKGLFPLIVKFDPLIASAWQKRDRHRTSLQNLPRPTAVSPVPTVEQD